MVKRFLLVSALALLVALVIGVMPFDTNAQGPSPVEPVNKWSPRVPLNNADLLAGKTEVRVIVQLQDAPLATYAGGVTGLRATSPKATGARRLSVATAESQAYLSYLSQKQATARTAILRAVPSARIDQQYSLVLNGFAVKVPVTQIEALRKLSGVRSISVEKEHTLDMDASIPLIGLGSGTLGGAWTDSGLWATVGGHANAGTGIKVADIDSGITPGNACFNPTGFSYPAGFPKYDTAADSLVVTPKIIVARSYFRADDPPVLPATALDDPGGVYQGGHGTHTAGTMVCNYGTLAPGGGNYIATQISGVAPKAQLLVYRVFYRSVGGSNSAYTPELLRAIEDALADGADVVNNSWGGTAVNTIDDPEVNAYSAAVDAGMVVVFSAGNSGSGSNTIGNPGTGDKFITVGASTTNRVFANVLNITAPATVPVTLTNLAAVPGSGPALTQTISATIKYVSSGSGLGCNPGFTAGTFTGQIAVIKRGTCTFAEKVTNATAAGAIAVIVTNNTGGLPSSMGALEATTIPSVMVSQNDGTNIINWYTANPGTAAAQILTTLNRFTDNASQDLMASFSSRGPNPNLSIKPDLVAPGVNILSSVSYGAGGVASNTGFDLFQGTSMAAPHVTGASALMRQLHPDWTPAQIKSALMSTAARPVSLGTNPMDRGSGRLNLTAPNDPGLTFDNPSISFGVPSVGSTVSRTVTAKNVTGSSALYTITVAANAGVAPTVSPTSTVIAAGGTAAFIVTYSPVAASTQYGALNITDGTANHTLHIQYWARPQTPLGDAQVLLIDDDYSNCTLGDCGTTLPNYSTFYTQTLTNLGISYAYYDTNPAVGVFTGWPIDQMRRYSKVIVFTGDSPGSIYFVGSPTFAQLGSYMANGGRLLMTGQDAAWGMVSGNPANANNSSVQLYFGGGFVQDSIFSAGMPKPAVFGTADYSPYLNKTYFDLGAGGDGANNQAFVDEIKAAFYNDTDALPILFASPVTPTLAYANLGTRMSSEPTIERVKTGPQIWTKLGYRSQLLSFGLEAVNNNTGYNTREQLLGRLLGFLDDNVGVSFGASSYQVGVPYSTLTVTANATMSIASTGGLTNTIQYYRWDFGDGTPIQVTGGNSAVHGYAARGVYNAYVEVMDSFGHKAVAGPIKITAGYSTFFPFIVR